MPCQGYFFKIAVGTRLAPMVSALGRLNCNKSGILQEAKDWVMELDIDQQ